MTSMDLSDGWAKAIEKIAQLEAEIAELRRTLERLRLENAEQKTIIEELLRRLHGKKSEKRTKPEPTPVGDDPALQAPPSPESVVRKPRPGHGRAPFAGHLPRDVIASDLSAAEKRCATCDRDLVPIGEDVCERGNVEPVKITIRRYVSKKYACPEGHEVKTSAGAPEGLVPRAKWTTETFAFVVTSKFGDHIPLDRLEGMLRRQGIDLPKSTMADMVQLVSEKIAPIIGQARLELLAESHLQADETHLNFVIEELKRRIKEGFLWAWKAKEKLLFEFDPSRSGDNAKRFLGDDWCGTLQVDGYAGYDAVIEANGITRAGCHSHARRKFSDAAKLKCEAATTMLVLMARLYWIERALKKRQEKRSLGAAEMSDLVRKVRNRRSRAQMARIETFRKQLSADPGLLPKSPLGKAVTYLTNQWETLLVYLDDPEVSIDNNAIERDIRPIAIGRKNWMVAGSTRGATAAARIYSIVNVCKALGIDPYVYLSDVLEKVSPHAALADLTPWGWKKAREAAAPAKSI